MRKNVFSLVLVLLGFMAFFLIGYNFGQASQREATERAIKVGEDLLAITKRYEKLCGR